MTTTGCNDLSILTGLPCWLIGRADRASECFSVRSGLARPTRSRCREGLVPDWASRPAACPKAGMRVQTIAGAFLDYPRCAVAT
jgi:hypothetical protein